MAGASTRAQSTPRGVFAKNNFRVSNGPNGLVGQISFDSTARTITANSTGIKIGSRYISTNTTGNATT